MATPNPLDTLTGTPVAGQALATGLMVPPFAGWLFHQIMFGVALCQFWHYTQSELYKKDSRRIKLLLWTVMTLDLGSTAVHFSQALHYGSSQARDAVTLFLGVPHIDCVPFALSGLIAFLVQSFLSMRCSKLFGEQKVLKLLCMAVIFISSGFALVGSFATTALWVVATLSPMGPTQSQVYITNIVLGVSMCLSAATDVIITLCLSLLLKSSVTGFNTTTDHVVQRIITLAMETAAYTSLLAVAGALMGVVFPREAVSTINILFAFISPLPSLYSLSLLVTLSSRTNLKKALETRPGFITPNDFSMSSVRGTGVVVSQERVIKTEVNLDQYSSTSRRVVRFPSSASFDVDQEKQQLEAQSETRESPRRERGLEYHIECT